MPDALMPELWRRQQALSTAELPLFSSDPLWLREPATPIERAFAEFHARHPEVFRRIEMLALNAMKRGERRISVSDFAEYLRKTETRRPDTSGYRINNNFRALYARLLVHQHPELEPLIEIRQRREKSA